MLQQVEYSKYLGVLIDAKLTWQPHIDYVFNKVLKFTSIFYKISCKLQIDILKMIYFAFVYPYLLYAVEIYGNTYQTHLNRLMVLNNKILRILQRAPRNTPVINLYSKFNTLTLPSLHSFQILKFVHKFIHHCDQLPPVFSAYFSKNSMFHSYDKDNLHLQLSQTNLGQRSIKFKGSSLWNTLPDVIRNTPSINAFNRKLREYLISNN